MSRLKSPFAFLGRSAAASDDDKDDKNKSKSKAEEKDDDDEDEDGKKKDKDKDDDAKSKSKADSDDDDDKKKKPDDEDDDGNGGKSKSKKAKADDDEDDTSASYKAGRAFERARVRAIMVSEAGQADPVAAAHVAFDSSMPRDQAISMLAAMSVSRAASGAPSTSREGLGDRMSSVRNPDVGADGGPSNGPSMADRIIAAGKKARGEA